ncbi:DUF1028 domain-containing protein [Microbacterium sp. APC 3898]|uniref:DUF1028 domain-containing protein n=1 Tax=Planococcus notacanthi TaxID=3035188 RepID=A0ABT7ZFB4_9BACL|nr:MULTISPECIES: DUF1028 domain-containing protein [Terrabacteria group]MDN3425814.1 DUF1028 domain-containing protein [Planococcus sp. APC 4016]MDN3500554.1 DUF1028 domain-containing protein [Microbacterium sp. APC 3898]
MINKEQLVATFSIVAADPETGEVGVAVQSKFLAVGSVVPWAKANVGAVATQSWANTAFGPEGLALLEKGLSPEEVIDKLVADDPDRSLRQVAVINAEGEASAFTGHECYDWAGHIIGKHHSCQGNILISEETVSEMSWTFEASEGPLAERMLKAVAAAQHAGGDSRGKQSAAVYVVQEGAGYGGYNDVKVDLRVDDHPEPIEELQRLYELHKMYAAPSEDKLAIEGDVLKTVVEQLVKLSLLGMGDYNSYNAEVKEALKAFVLRENFDDHWSEEALIDESVLAYLKKQ